jgi:hypothetical protein
MGLSPTPAIKLSYNFYFNFGVSLCQQLAIPWL